MSSVLKVNEVKDGDKIHIDSSFDMDLLSDTSDYISLVKEEDNDNDGGPEKK